MFVFFSPFAEHQLKRDQVKAWRRLPLKLQSLDRCLQPGGRKLMLPGLFHFPAVSRFAADSLNSASRAGARCFRCQNVIRGATGLANSGLALGNIILYYSDKQKTDTPALLQHPAAEMVNNRRPRVAVAE
ncbi:hypothetical protein DNTS_008272 [Danionella cerebrum]|uniref:Uncharacterized protein n=1 Tax=Danionella cerebrum TaxID=2873325 RepID=A0A553R6F3_9TELE|nr:hypothetical protein DNTS_008272 [Danionella translucida]